MYDVRIVSGDIASVEADALITAINSGGVWCGGIDGVIMRTAGEMFHQQAANASPLTHGQTVVARSNGTQHAGAYRNVVFVVDDLRGALRDIIYNGLKAAAEAGFRTVSLPTIRMGVMLGQVERSAGEAVEEMAVGVTRFFKENPGSDLQSITFVVYNDPGTQRLLTEAFSVQ